MSPHPACEIRPHIERVDACQRRGGKALAQRRVHRVVDELHAARDGRRGIEAHDLGAEVSALGIRLSALSMENGSIKRSATMPKAGHSSTSGPLFKHEAQRQHGQHQPARRNAQIEGGKIPLIRSRLLSVCVDHLPQRGDLLRRKRLARGEGRDKGGQRAVKRHPPPAVRPARQ